VFGLDGGALGGLVLELLVDPAPPATPRNCEGAEVLGSGVSDRFSGNWCNASANPAGDAVRCGRCGLTFRLEALEGGPLPDKSAEPSIRGAVLDGGGAPVALGARLGGPFGGGGVGAETGGAAAPAFLLTHFLRVSS
jgi:hypothetical protein